MRFHCNVLSMSPIGMSIIRDILLRARLAEVHYEMQIRNIAVTEWEPNACTCRWKSSLSETSDKVPTSAGYSLTKMTRNTTAMKEAGDKSAEILNMIPGQMPSNPYRSRKHELTYEHLLPTKKKH